MSSLDSKIYKYIKDYDIYACKNIGGGTLRYLSGHIDKDKGKVSYETGMTFEDMYPGDIMETEWGVSEGTCDLKDIDKVIEEELMRPWI
jgi:hypothetical protein|nr:MAG TPA: hypothetical protein [Caudoviricetes sp.]